MAPSQPLLTNNRLSGLKLPAFKPKALQIGTPPPPPPPPLSPTLNRRTEPEDKRFQSLDKAMQQLNLSKNNLQEENQKFRIQIRELRTAVDELRAPRAQPATFYARALQDLPVYATKDARHSERTFHADERAVLVQPTYADKVGNVWISLRTLFENGTIEDQRVLFYDAEAKQLVWTDLTL